MAVNLASVFRLNVMDCLSPIRITSPSKYLSTCFSDPFISYVRCGKCANCQETLSREWYYRAFYEYQSTVENDGYMLMDCLTYSNKYVPRVDRYFRRDREDNSYFRLPRKLNFMCFDYTDLRLFFVRLRRYLSKRGFEIEKSLRYFAACEYGTQSDRTHRPHIHILFYCTTPGLDNLTLSRAISTCWKFGRTDGLPYKSVKYVNDFTISKGLVSSQRACKYVTKYVMKSSEFQKVVDKRIAAIMHWVYANRSTYYAVGKQYYSADGILQTQVKNVVDWSSFETFSVSVSGRKLYRDLRRRLDQFHRQSLGFGASALDTMSIDEIMDTNIVKIPDANKIVMRIGLPMYYKRKLFYEQVKVDGVKYWQPTTLGRRYLDKRKKDSFSRMREMYMCANLNYGLNLPADELSDYVVNVRGRIDGVFDGDSSIVDRMNSPAVLYNYNTISDKRYFHNKFISRNYLGNHKIGYNENVIDYMPIEKFIGDFVRISPEYESMLDELAKCEAPAAQSKQRLHDNKQRLNQIYKNLRM